MKRLLLFFILFSVFIVACQQAVKKEVIIEKKGTEVNVPVHEVKPQLETRDAADAIGNDISDVEATDKDLSSDDLGDLDTTLADIQNI